MKKTKLLTTMAFYIAMDIVLTRLTALMPTTAIRISLSFVALALAGWQFGSIFAMGVAGVSDVLGFLLFPPNAPYHPGFTLSAMLTAAAFGYLRGKEANPWQIGFLLVVIAVTIEMLLNTYWLSNLQNLPFLVMLAKRLIGILTNLVLRIIILVPLLKTVQKHRI